MSNYFSSLAPEVKAHIKNLVRSARLDENEDSLELLAAGWLEKQQAFFEQTKKHNMEEVDGHNIDDPRGALVMTYSGSLINIGPERDDYRSVKYYSIGLRNDVPESAEDETAVISADIIKGIPLEFEKGPIIKSSPAYAIAVFREEIEPEREEILLDEITMIVAEDFTSINKTTILED